ncbi:MAG: type II toxin-antitoxin system PrlF family antitoxin [Oscillospiraceae bacterium]|nr:type II toxin-antitoxin system PrlF family antitoxin [Oscillospiraceae bacterium]
MKRKTLRILGNRGTTTVPIAIRRMLGLNKNDVLSFSITDADTFTVKRERLCKTCKPATPPNQKQIADFMGTMPPSIRENIIAYCLNSGGKGAANP